MNAVDGDIKTRVFKIESLNTHNGPGYRTVIYLKGCPLHCLWCHNPESISSQKEIWVLHNKCIGCMSCVEACPENALTYPENRIEVDRDRCTGCHNCAEACPSKAIEKIGEDLTVNEVLSRVMKDKPFLDASGGGITVTGGEPGVAPEFVTELFRRCRDEGIHTAFDTSGFISEKALETIIPHTDLVFFDLKVMDDEAAKRLTGQDTKRIFASLEWIGMHMKKHGHPEVQFRTPVIPGMTDSAENLNSIAAKIKTVFSGLETSWELNLFNDICEDKYLRLNKEWAFKDVRFDEDDYRNIEDFSKKNQELNITIAGFFQKQQNGN